MIPRRQSKQLSIGSIKVGGNAPISVQSMTKTDTRDAAATINQINRLKDYGCEIIRIAVPDDEAADALKTIIKASPIPVIADIHFDHRLALAALKAGIHGLRLNPGNIRKHEHVRKVVNAAAERNVPIRIGINAGSLPPSDICYESAADYMVAVALKEVKFLESLDFDLIKISLKAFDVRTTISAYHKIAELVPYPLHLGITEAGLPRTGIIRSSAGIGILLYEGLGDTIRVSLSTEPCEEVFAGFEILKSLNLRQRGPTLVSCPTCGRTEADVIPLAEAIDRELQKIDKPIKVAVMGCVVNGPGEAKDADIGIACGKGKGALFKKGKVIRTIDESEFFSALLDEINRFCELD